jgi:hypothetical protein
MAAISMTEFKTSYLLMLLAFFVVFAIVILAVTGYLQANAPNIEVGINK